MLRIRGRIIRYSRGNPAMRLRYGRNIGNAHIDLAIWNFGIQEQTYFGTETQEVFPGCLTFENGYMIVNENPGFGIDVDEALAAKYPIPEDPWYRPIVRMALQ